MNYETNNNNNKQIIIMYYETKWGNFNSSFYKQRLFTLSNRTIDNIRCSSLYIPRFARSESKIYELKQITTSKGKKKV